MFSHTLYASVLEVCLHSSPVETNAGLHSACSFAKHHAGVQNITAPAEFAPH